MGEAGHHGAGMVSARSEARSGDQRPASTLVELILHPETQVGRDLVVARARRVQAAGGEPDQFGQPIASTFMWMSSSARENVKRRPRSLSDRVQPVSDFFLIFLRRQ
jgi:hypothetical protein